MTTNKLLLIVTCVLLTVLSGVLRGTLGRGNQAEMNAAAERVESLPLDLGNWIAETDGDLEEDALKMLQCTGSTVRSYVHKRTKEVVSLIFLVGPAGPLAVHTPDVCYGSNNFTVKEPKRGTVVSDVNGNKHDFLEITFTENKIGKRPLRVYYAWHDATRWLAPTSARTAFAGKPMLYKVQLATNALGDEDTSDAAARFLSENLPTLEAICQ